MKETCSSNTILLLIRLSLRLPDKQVYWSMCTGVSQISNLYECSSCIYCNFCMFIAFNLHLKDRLRVHNTGKTMIHNQITSDVAGVSNTEKDKNNNNNKNKN